MSLTVQILCAIALDLLIGDPRRLPHPVIFIARLARRLEAITRARFSSERTAGIVTALATIFATAITAFSVLEIASLVHPLFGDLLGILLLSTTLAAKSLADHALAIARPLAAGDLASARTAVGMIVSRNAEALSEAGVVRSAVESVSENTVDGVTAPLFFAVLFGPVGAITYKAINTLDSNFGYMNETYREFGWASARIDDLANLVPARLSMIIMMLAAAILRFDFREAIKIGVRDGQKHPSPNSALCEAVTAGAIGIRLGGPNVYFGVTKEKPWLGDGDAAPAARHIEQAVVLMLATHLLFAAVLLGLRTLA